MKATIRNRQGLRYSAPHSLEGISDIIAMLLLAGSICSSLKATLDLTVASGNDQIFRRTGRALIINLILFLAVAVGWALYKRSIAWRSIRALQAANTELRDRTAGAFVGIMRRYARSLPSVTEQQEQVLAASIDRIYETSIAPPRVEIAPNPLNTSPDQNSDEHVNTVHSSHSIPDEKRRAAGPAAIESDVRDASPIAVVGRELPSARKEDHRHRREQSPTAAFLSKVMIPLAGIIVTLGLALVSRYDNRESLQRQLQNQAALAENQRKTSEAQLATALLTSIVRGSPEERRSALSILSSAAPSYAKQISAALLSSGAPPDKIDISQAFIQQIEQKSDDNDRMQQFKQHLQNARKYREYEQFNAAFLEYSQAYENIPPAWATSIANGVAEARALYDRGKFEEADEKFEAELSRVST